MQTAPRYYFPAEWAPHRATWLSYPHNPKTWPGDRMERILPVYNEFVRIVSTGEAVHINVRDASDARRTVQALAAAGAVMRNIVLHETPTNDAWCRDHGPCFVLDRETGRKTVINWRFNAWGGKYPYALDDRIPERVATLRGLPRVDPGLVLEGGSIDVNGAGGLLTTTACLCNPNRNPHLSTAELEAVLARYYGVDQVIWLGEGIAGDDTDGHVDDITRFIAATRVVTAVEPDAGDVNHAPLQENLERLKAVRGPDGGRLAITALPMPDPIVDEGLRLPASYANFYICNAAVIVPTFRCRQDAQALKILRGCFDRPVIGVDARDIIYGLGGFHCLSQQEPLAPGDPPPCAEKGAWHAIAD